MAKTKTPPSATPLTLDAIKSMSQPERIVTFKFQADAGQRAFSAMGKLYRVIEENLAPGEKLFPTLMAAGIKKGTISNATYAAKVYDMVIRGKLSEAEYESLGFTECVAVCQVQTEKSKRRLTPEEVVAAIRTNADFEDDLKALFTLGITASQKEAAEASVKAKKDAAVAESAAKAEQQKAETERLLAENAALKAASAAIASAAAPAAAPAPAAANPVAAPAANPAAAPTAAAPAANPAAPLLATILALLDEVEASVQGLSEQEQVTVTARLAEMAEMFATA